MKENKQFRKLIIIIVILLIAVVFVKWFDQQRKGIEVGFPLTKLALKIDKWEGTNMGVSEKEKGWIEQGDLIVRQYKHNEDIVYMVAIQERGDRHRVHSPVDCYSGSGWVVLKKDIVKLNSKGRPVKRIHVKKSDADRIVYYWFTNGTSQCAGFKMHLIMFLRDVLVKGDIKSWVCFQISADIKNSPEETEHNLKEFISAMDKGGI